MLGVRTDEEAEEHLLAFAPYTVRTRPLAAGEHVVHLTAYINRTNTFGAVHNTDLREKWYGHQLWRTAGDCWTYDYVLMEEGVLRSPKLTLLTEESD